MTADAAAQAVPKRSATEEVAEQIRLHVESEGLLPGHRLGREEDLARQFGVSRPTLREALRLLSSSHLIRASKGRGGGIFVANTAERGLGLSVSASVATMVSAESTSMEELLETRMLLEVPLVGLAAQRATPAQVAAMDELVKESRSAADRGAEVSPKLDAGLHRLITEAAGNRLAASLTSWIGDVLQPSLREMIRPVVVESVLVDQHEDIVAAVARGDPRGAERTMREHLAYLTDLVATVERLEAAASESGPPSEPTDPADDGVRGSGDF